MCWWEGQHVILVHVLGGRSGVISDKLLCFEIKKSINWEGTMGDPDLAKPRHRYPAQDGPTDPIHYDE